MVNSQNKSSAEVFSSKNKDKQQNKPKSDSMLTRTTAIGHAVWLMSQSPLHKHMMMTDIDWLVTPPIILNQFRLWQKQGAPLGFATWAYLGEEAEERIVGNGIRRLMPTDWKSGENLWLIDFVSPFGGQEQMFKELKDQVFNGQRIKSLQPSPDGKGVGVMEW